MVLTPEGGSAYAADMRAILVVAIIFLVGSGRAWGQTPACTFVSGALPVDTLPPGGLHGNAIPVEHIIVMMQENRSYDHYFGKLRRASGPPGGTTNPDPLGGDRILATEREMRELKRRHATPLLTAPRRSGP